LKSWLEDMLIRSYDELDGGDLEFELARRDMSVQ
jgi:hypothetical protein